MALPLRARTPIARRLRREGMDVERILCRALRELEAPPPHPASPPRGAERGRSRRRRSDRKCVNTVA